jgi:hypothetical protein
MKVLLGSTGKEVAGTQQADSFFKKILSQDSKPSTVTTSYTLGGALENSGSKSAISSYLFSSGKKNRKGTDTVITSNKKRDSKNAEKALVGSKRESCSKQLGKRSEYDS